MTDYSDSYDPDTDFDRFYTIATGEAIAEHLGPRDRVLEMGCATGLMSSLFVAAGATVVGVDRSEAYLARARARHLISASFVQDNVSHFRSGVPYDHVVVTNVIHELEHPGQFLRHCHHLLRHDGMLHLASQNPESVHRLVALDLGLICDCSEVSERGRQWGTVRLYTAFELEALAVNAGFSLIGRQGIVFKPLPNDEMARLPVEVLEGFRLVAHRFPDNCAVNYLTFRA